MPEENSVSKYTNNPEDVPVPVVNFSRWVYFTILIGSIAAQFIPGITLLFLLLLPGAVFGRKWNIIGRVAKRVLQNKLQNVQYENRQLIKFNNALLLLFLGSAQIAFLAGLKIIGWAIVSLAIAANGLALAGFCIGCVFYFRFKLYRYKLFGQN